MGTIERQHVNLEMNFTGLEKELIAKFQALSDDLTTSFSEQSKYDIQLENRIDKCFSEMDERFNRVDERFEKLERQVDARFKSIQGAIDFRFNRVDERFKQVDERFEKLEGQMNARFEKVETRLDRMETLLTRILERLPG